MVGVNTRRRGPPAINNLFNLDDDGDIQMPPQPAPQHEEILSAVEVQQQDEEAVLTESGTQQGESLPTELVTLPR